MKYKQGMKLYEIRANTRVQDVPLTHPIFWKVFNRPRTKRWVERSVELAGKDNLGPIYYCKRCRQIEDGAHRTAALNMQGETTAEIKIHKDCIHANSGYWGLLEALIFQQQEKGGYGIQKKDRAWLRACVDKWIAIRDIVDFEGKTFLDIGSHCGYLVLEAWRYGAKNPTGIEKRLSIFKIGAHAVDLLDLHEEVLLINEEWQKHDVEPVDIVSCLGLMHYFKGQEYEDFFQKILDTAKETIILELRTIQKGTPELIEKGEQTLATTAWLKKRFEKNGFSVTAMLPRAKPTRKIIIAEKRAAEE